MILKYKDKIQQLSEDIKAIEREEREEKVMKATENQMNRVKRKLEEPETGDKASRSWFQTHQERMMEKGWHKSYEPTDSSFQV